MSMGDRIRSLRRKRGLTVQGLASSCGLSKGFISQVENGRTSPSLSTLTELARVLGVTPAFLVCEAEPGAHVTRANGRYQSDGVAPRSARAVLLSERPQRGFDLYMIELPAGARYDGGPLGGVGEQAVHLLSGRARVQYGEEQLDLGPGDTAHWQVASGVAIVNLGADIVRLMLSNFPASVAVEPDAVVADGSPHNGSGYHAGD